jgi:hypothetical protein
VVIEDDGVEMMRSDGAVGGARQAAWTIFAHRG